MAKVSFLQDSVLYAQQAREFEREDWIRYVAWVGLMSGLLVAVGSFLALGATHGVTYPAYVWNIPFGVAVFVAAIAFDSIGHFTTYKHELEKGEALVHKLTIAAGISSVVTLCIGYEYAELVRIPALALIALSFVYSLVDEVLHWRRYLTQKCDRVETWAHFFILVGHSIFILAWWKWFDAGYPGVAETLTHLPG